ncbi:MAG: hypothetical protein R3265_08685, partial [Hyphomonas sp.]|nr:hypothetical protein [Hyphomonas sp.]
AAAFLAGVLGGFVPLSLPPLVQKALSVLSGLLVGTIFLGRGIIGILPAFERSAPEMPFLTLNRRLYSPLSFLIGVGFILLVLSLANWSWRLGLE